MLPKDVQAALGGLQGRASERAWVFPPGKRPFCLNSELHRPNEIVIPKDADMARAILAHNHLGEDFFSDDDLRTAVQRDLAETWVVTPNGFRFGLVLRQGHGISADEMINALDGTIKAMDGTKGDEDYVRLTAKEFDAILKKRFGARARLKYNEDDGRPREPGAQKRPRR